MRIEEEEEGELGLVERGLDEEEEEDELIDWREEEETPIERS